MTWVSQWFYPLGSQLSCEILSPPRITVCFGWDLVSPMGCTCALKITVKCRKYTINILGQILQGHHMLPQLTEIHIFWNFQQNHITAANLGIKILRIWTSLQASCRSWLHWSDLIPLIGRIKASTSKKRGALAQCHCQRSQMYLRLTGWEQSALDFCLVTVSTSVRWRSCRSK